MTLTELIQAHGNQARFAKAIGADKASLNRVVKGHRPLGAALACRIYRATGHKLGPIADATPKQIEAIERLSVRSA